jgi:hypothetical protein
MDQLPLWARLQEAIQGKLREGDVSYTIQRCFMTGLLAHELLMSSRFAVKRK